MKIPSCETLKSDSLSSALELMSLTPLYLQVTKLTKQIFYSSTLGFLELYSPRNKLLLNVMKR